MLSRKFLVVFLLSTAALLPAVANAQSNPTGAAAPAAQAADASSVDGGAPEYLKPETAEQRKARVGADDPGPNPDPEKVYFRYGRQYKIEKFDRRWVVYTGGDAGWVRPFGFANVYKELYQQNEKWVWVWMPQDVKEIAEQAAIENPAEQPYPERSLQYFRSTRPEFASLPPAQSTKTVTFTESSKGLPDNGSWRNTLAVADMNKDGFLDIVAPPERGGGNLPAIFLGDGQGGWKYWDTVKWPFGLNYGSVGTADFNKDGNIDIALGVHLDGVHVLLHDGKGVFTDSSKGLPRDYPTRRIIITDADRDGFQDIVTISEGPTTVQKAVADDYAKIRVYYNREKGATWQGANIPEPGREVGGDWLSAGNFNADSYPDFIGASIYYNGPDVLYLSDGAKKWKSVGGSAAVAQGKDPLISLLAYHFANTAGKFTSKKLDDAIVSTVRFWPDKLSPRDVPEPPVKQVTSIDRITFTGKEPKRESIMRWKGSRPVPAMGNGDFDGDGNLDIVFLRYEPQQEFVMLLGDGKGGFTQAKLDGLKTRPNAAYDLTVADVNGDKRPDVLVSYEATGNTSLGVRDGSIRVFLNRGAASETSAVTAAK